MSPNRGILIPPLQCEIDNEHILNDQQIREVVKFEHKNRNLKNAEKIKNKKIFITKFAKKHKVNCGIKIFSYTCTFGQLSKFCHISETPDLSKNWVSI